MDYIWSAIMVVYIILTHLIAKYIGAKREIGYGKSVFWSILLTPIIGLIITKMSKPIDVQ
jgi:Na+-driven multidrug efflux pump